MKLLAFMFVLYTASALELAPLPYADTALEPALSQRTLQIHHGKHHAKYVATTNDLIKGTEHEGKSAQEILMAAHEEKNQGLFNNAAQSWNHAFYWQCMSPQGGGEMASSLATAFEASFGSIEEFKKQFAAAGNTAFGSGWAWLVADKSGTKLSVTKTIGAGNPMTEGLLPLLTMDVWEHAYYLDHQNVRANYVDTFLSRLVNWDFVDKNLQALRGNAREL